MDELPTDGTWPTGDVARWAGVTSRTLRHYDDLGLVRPAYVGAGGQRYYGREQLLRLQEVLVLRELGLPLDDIARVLDDGEDRAAALRRHHTALLAERDRLARLAATVERTIEDIERKEPVMRAEELFEGFDAEKQERYERDLVDRYGEGVQEKIDASWRRVRRMSKDDAERVQAELAAVEEQYAALLDEGVDPADPRVQEAAARHYAWVAQFWTPDAESFAGLGDLYVDHPDFKARYDAIRPGMAEYLRDAMAVYAVERMT